MQALGDNMGLVVRFFVLHLPQMGRNDVKTFAAMHGLNPQMAKRMVLAALAWARPHLSYVVVLIGVFPIRILGFRTIETDIGGIVGPACAGLSFLGEHIDIREEREAIYPALGFSNLPLVFGGKPIWHRDYVLLLGSKNIYARREILWGEREAFR
jgi:hypothetical protein